MSRQITLGQVNADQSMVNMNLAIPALDSFPDLLPGLSIGLQAVKEATERRTGVIVVGPKWSGKSTGIERAVRMLRDEEAAVLARMPESYKPLQYLYLHGMTAKTAREVLLALLAVVSPNTREREHGSRLKDDALRAKLIVTLLNKNYCCIVLDEAEYLGGPVVDQLRKIMSDATATDNRRVVKTATGEEYRAAGVGIVLCGTADTMDTVSDDADAGYRWSDGYAVPLLPPDAVATVYEAIFPRFAEHVARIGADAWRTFGEQTIAQGRPYPIGRIALHARKYFSLLADSTLDSAEPVRTRERTPFVQEVFLYAFTSMDWAAEHAHQRARERGQR